MPRAQYPSDAFPALPSLVLDVPDGWSELPAAASLIAIGAPPEEGAFRPNVTVSVYRHDGSVELGRLSSEIFDGYSARGTWELVGQAEAVRGGRQSWAAEVAFAYPDTGTLVQVHRLLRVPNGASLVDFVHVCATCGADQVEVCLQLLREVCDSIAVADPSGTRPEHQGGE